MSAPEVNAPAEFEEVGITCPVALLVMVILAPETTAPEGSVATPWMLPVATVDWPMAIEDNNSADSATIAAAANRAPVRREFSFSMVNLPFGQRFEIVWSRRALLAASVANRASWAKVCKC